ncbi:MAG TPA: SRPBCC family protein [Mycobacterium sp.]|uniref:SRPBCC family protein n=1 Tax=Mycobacterium sp. TaxID=1785 RepID=UPI002D665AC3|nr:SRPBCC family protein [Mycobacterium sp.]HZU47930.1 SRPBCC family protein [Mycobacterium sp.]
MAQTVTVAKRIRRPLEEVGALVADPHRFIPALATMGRCEYIADSDQGQLWDVFLVSGTLHLGGRVLVTHSENGRLSWRSLRGTRHTLEGRVERDGDACRITLALTYSLTGLVIARFNELIGRAIVARNLEAAAEELRHRLEFENGNVPIDECRDSRSS